MLRTTILAALALSAAPAYAADGMIKTTSAHVRVADLDLAHEPGRAELDRRLNRAIRIVCPPPREIDILTRSAHRRCLSEASRSADTGRDTALVRAALARLQVASSAR